MIVSVKRGNVLTDSELPVAFAVNSEGVNDSGFAGQVAEAGWGDLAMIGATELGSFRARNVNGRVFYAMCVHSLARDPAWTQAPELLLSILQDIKLLGHNPDPPMWNFAPGGLVAVPLPGAGPVGQAQRADVTANLYALARTDLSVQVWTR